MISSSLQSTYEIMSWPPVIWPKEPQWDTLGLLFDKWPVDAWMFNSAICAITVTLASVFLFPFAV